MLLARDLARSLDPVILARDCGIEPDPWQQDLLRCNEQRILELAVRQSGKTTTTGVIALHTALYMPASLTLILSPGERQSKEMLRTISGMHARLDGVPRLDSDSVTKMEFEHGSRLLALPGTEKTVRGIAAPQLVVVDEAARVESDLISAILPMLTISHGRLIMLSTPFAKEGTFYEQWHDADSAWHRVKVTTDMCPRLTAEALAEAMRILGPTRYQTEYGLEWHDAEEAAFLGSVIERAFSDQSVLPLWQ